MDQYHRKRNEILTLPPAGFKVAAQIIGIGLGFDQYSFNSFNSCVACIYCNPSVEFTLPKVHFIIDICFRVCGWQVLK